MARILTGIQSTGTPHLGNILGAIIPAIKMAENPKNDSYLFIDWILKKQCFTDKVMSHK